MGPRHKRSYSDAEAGRMVKHRRYFTIPKDQLNILDQEQSWVTDIDNVAQSIASNLIPPHVIENIAALYLRNERAKTDGPKSPSASPQLPRLASQHSSTSRKNVSRPRSPTPASSPEHSIEWSPSPPSQRHQRARDAPTTEASTLKPVNSPGFATQPTAVRRPVTPDVDHSSSSDGGQEEDLEVEIPEAATTSTPLVRLPSLQEPQKSISGPQTVPTTNNTPPCAQPPPVIPSTIVAADQSFAQPRRRKMRPINFDDIADDEPRTRAMHSTSGIRMPTTKVFKAMDSSATRISSSFVPATMQEPHSPSSEISLSKDSNGGLADLGTRNISKGPVGKESASANLSLGLEPTISNSKPTINADKDLQIAAESTTTLKAPLVKGEDPYQHFINIYPCYESKHKGNQSLFIRACISLDYLRQNLALKSLLFDDFVGAFSDGYIDYVRAARADQEPLPALEWYNKQETDVLYNRRVLSMHNLALVHAAYPEEYVRGSSLFHKALKEQKELRAEFLRGQSRQQEVTEKEAIIETATGPKQHDAADSIGAEEANATDKWENPTAMPLSQQNPNLVPSSQRQSRNEADDGPTAGKQSSHLRRGAQAVPQLAPRMPMPAQQHNREAKQGLQEVIRDADATTRVKDQKTANKGNSRSKPSPVFMPPPPISSSLEGPSPAEVRTLGEARDAGNRQYVASDSDGRHTRSPSQPAEFGKRIEATISRRLTSISGRSADHRSTSPPPASSMAPNSPSHNTKSAASGGESSRASPAPSARPTTVKPGPPPSSSLRSMTSSAVPSSSARRSRSSGMTYLQRLQAGTTDSALQARLREKAREKRMSGRASVASGTSPK